MARVVGKVLTATKIYFDSTYFNPTLSGGSVEGTAVLSTGEDGGTKFLREDGDGTCSWQTPAGGTPTVASGAEVDTGTDNTKMVTPKAMEDSSYIKLSAVHTQNTDTGTTGNTFTIDSDSSTGKIIIDVALNAGENHSLTLTNSPLTEDRTITLPDGTGTVAFETHLHGNYLPNGLSDYGDCGTPASTDTFLMLTSNETTQGLTVESLLKYLDSIYVKI